MKNPGSKARSSRRWFLIALAAALVARSPGATPNDFFKRGTPTFIAGTTAQELESAFRAVFGQPQ